jgi:hypothetical protein
MRPLPARDVLDRYFLEVRAKLLEVAAVLDRIDRGGGVADERLVKVREALRMLGEPTSHADRAERIQLLFSLPYDAGWRT